MVRIHIFFFGMKLVKTNLQNQINNKLLSDYLVRYIEKELFSIILNEDNYECFKNKNSSRR